MKTYFVILGIFTLVAAGALVLAKVYIAHTQTQTPLEANTDTVTSAGLPTVNAGGSNTTTGAPTSSSTSVRQMAVLNIYGSTTTVNDFIHNPATVTSPNFPGHYFLAGGVNPSQTDAPYSTFFDTSDQSFNITLLIEPISKTRQAAEQGLIQELGISQDDMCRLRYSVTVPNFVDTTYSGKNLGFSFCPGATQLP